MIKMSSGLHVKYPLVLSDFNENYSFSKNTQTLNFIKIRPVGAELFHADGRTYRQYEANNRFSQLCESAHKSELIIDKCIITQYKTVYRAKCTKVYCTSNSDMFRLLWNHYQGVTNFQNILIRHIALLLNKHNII